MPAICSTCDLCCCFLFNPSHPCNSWDVVSLFSNPSVSKLSAREELEEMMTVSVGRATKD